MFGLIFWLLVALTPIAAILGSLVGCKSGKLRWCIMGGFFGAACVVIASFVILFVAAPSADQISQGSHSPRFYWDVHGLIAIALSILVGAVVGLPTGLVVWFVSLGLGGRSRNLPGTIPRQESVRLERQKIAYQKRWDSQHEASLQYEACRSTPVPSPGLPTAHKSEGGCDVASPVHVTPREERADSRIRVWHGILWAQLIVFTGAVVYSGMVVPFQRFDVRWLLLCILFTNLCLLLRGMWHRRLRDRIYAERIYGTELASKCSMKLGDARVQTGVACVRSGVLFLIPISGTQVSVRLKDISDAIETKWQKGAPLKTRITYYPFLTVFRFKTPSYARIEFAVVDPEPWRRYLRQE